MTLVMEITKAIVAKDPLEGSTIADEEYDRQPFEHPQLQSVDNLNVEGPMEIAGKEKLYALGTEAGLLDVVRWKPRLVSLKRILHVPSRKLTHNMYSPRD